MDPFIANCMARQEADRIKRSGQTVLVNGAAQTTQAIWEQAQPGRVSGFVTEDDWARGVYIVLFLPTVLGAPWNLKNGSEVIREKLNWRTVVRHVDVIDPADVLVVVSCVCAIVPS